MVLTTKRITFDTSTDVVDYVTKGLPPTPYNYKKLMDGICWENSDNTLHISKNAMQEMNTEQIRAVMDRVYQNRIENTAVVIACLVVAFGAGLILGGVGGKEKSDE